MKHAVCFQEVRIALANVSSIEDVKHVRNDSVINTLKDEIEDPFVAGQQVPKGKTTKESKNLENNQDTVQPVYKLPVRHAIQLWGREFRRSFILHSCFYIIQ